MDSTPYTFIGKLKGITLEGKSALNKRVAFCTLLRKLVKAKQTGKVVDKPKLCARFNLPARMFNTALLYADAVVSSAIECQKMALEDVEHDINRQVVEAFWSPAEEQHGRVRKLIRLYRQRKSLLAQRGNPHIHFGRKEYQDQAAKGWKQAYEEARNDRIGSLGSADEAGGNSTFQIKAVQVEGKPRFELHHARKLMGTFKLDAGQQLQLEAVLAINHQPFAFTNEIAKQGKRKGQLVDRKVTTGRTPLTVWLLRRGSHWYAHVSFFKTRPQPDYTPVGAIGVDLNCDSIADSWVTMADGAPLVVQHHKRMFDPNWSKNQKATWIYEQINELVQTAKTNRLMICLEYLDFEHCKRWLRTKLGTMLRIMPYRKIRQAFERRCREHGVVLRYVKSNYTSLLGAVLSDYPNLGRDQAAGAIIGLRGMEAGNAWLEEQCQSLAVEQRTRLRINRKRKFGCTVTIDGVLIARQLKALPSEDRGADVHQFQNRAGRAISELSTAMGAHFYNRGVLPVCWKETSSGWIGRQAAIPAVKPATGKSSRHIAMPGVKAPLRKTECSSLSN